MTPFEAINLEREPATGLRVLPPGIRLPTLFRRLAPEREMARPRSLPNALHVRALLATRRSSTSAIENDLQARPTDLETRTRSGEFAFTNSSRDA